MQLWPLPNSFGFMQGSVVCGLQGARTLKDGSSRRIMLTGEAVSVCFPATGIQSVMQGRDLRRLQLMGGAPMLKVHHSTQKKKKNGM